LAFDNKGAKEQLIKLLRQPRQALLVVGSGSSVPLGYPTWQQLLDELRARVVPELACFPTGDLLERASLIKRFLDQYDDRTARLRQYEQYLSERFKQHNPGHAFFHRTLVQLPFCGIVTTNYDPVLEHAATFVGVQNGHSAQCITIDLCSCEHFLVFQFLRDLAAPLPTPSAVLHVHGFWKNPHQMILSSEDYDKSYGLVEAGGPTTGPLALPKRSLHTLHRKVVWSLLTMHPAVFVGFSMEDPAFVKMLEFIREDFELAPDPPKHFALLGSRTEEEREQDMRRLWKFGVMPVFYDVITDPSGSGDHTALTNLIEELGANMNVVPTTPSVDSITRRLLER